MSYRIVKWYTCVPVRFVLEKKSRNQNKHKTPLRVFTRKKIESLQACRQKV